MAAAVVGWVMKYSTEAIAVDDDDACLSVGDLAHASSLFPASVAFILLFKYPNFAQFVMELWEVSNHVLGGLRTRKIVSNCW